MRHFNSFFAVANFLFWFGNLDMLGKIEISKDFYIQSFVFIKDIELIKIIIFLIFYFMVFFILFSLR